MENFHVDLAEVVAVVTEASLLAIVYYPDSKKLGIWSRADGYQAMLPVEPTLDYWDGES
jgi:hypothetical protein